MQQIMVIAGYVGLAALSAVLPTALIITIIAGRRGEIRPLDPEEIESEVNSNW